MNTFGTINTSYIVEYDANCENFENLENKFIIKVINLVEVQLQTFTKQTKWEIQTNK